MKRPKEQLLKDFWNHLSRKMSFQVRAWIAYLIESKWENKNYTINTDEELQNLLKLKKLDTTKTPKLNNTTSIGDFSVSMD